MIFKIIEKNLIKEFNKIKVQSPSKQNIFLNEVGIIMQSAIADRYVNEGRPLNWAPLKPSTIAQKKKLGYTKMLQRTGALKKWSYTVSGDEVKIHPSVFYAIFHEKGTTKMPARPAGYLTSTEITLFQKAFNRIYFT